MRIGKKNQQKQHYTTWCTTHLKRQLKYTHLKKKNYKNYGPEHQPRPTCSCRAWCPPTQRGSGLRCCWRSSSSECRWTLKTKHTKWNMQECKWFTVQMFSVYITLKMIFSLPPPPALTERKIFKIGETKWKCLEFKRKL